MIKIADFDNVLEVAFGLNALFYIFELIPHTEDRLKELYKENQKLYKRKVELTKNTEAFPIGFVISSTYPFFKRIFVRLSILISVILLGFMLYSSYKPDAQLNVTAMTTLLVFGYGIPFITLIKHNHTIALMKAANHILDEQIEKADRSQDKFTINMGGSQIIILGSQEVKRKKFIYPLLSQLTTNSKVSFIKIGKKDKNTFMKVTGRLKTGYFVEHRETDINHHFKASLAFSKDVTVEILSLYLNENMEWKDMADWVLITPNETSEEQDSTCKTVTITAVS